MPSKQFKHKKLSHRHRKAKTHVAWNTHMAGFKCEDNACDGRGFYDLSDPFPEHCGLIMKLATPFEEDQMRKEAKLTTALHKNRGIRDA